jgi:hypothetical protein
MAWCKDELSWFQEQVQSRVFANGRVFVLRAQQTETNLWPDFLRDERGHALPGFSFYDPKDGLPFGFQQSEPGDEYYQELSRLTIWLTKRLRELRASFRPDEFQASARAAARAALAAVEDSANSSARVAASVAAGAATVVAANDSGFLAASDAAAEAAAKSGTWEQIRIDIGSLRGPSMSKTADRPLWSSGAPGWATHAWTELKTALPKGEDWDVWIDWYEQRLRGEAHGEDYDRVFASVPQEEWDKGPRAANALIKAHLPKAPEAGRTVNLPEPMAGLDGPFTYSWTGSYRVALASGAQNLPFYPHFSSEGDHRHALEACRLGAERLLKALHEGRYGNTVKREYRETLEYYLNDLPKTAGEGNILLANDQIRVLHAMFLVDDMLPDGFASRLKSVIANQFALNAFYDLVQRHNEAVNAGNWSHPFPLDAARGFFGTVEDNTPRWFEREVKKGLRQVEEAEPPPMARPERAMPNASVIDPPPLPPGTPDAQDSWKRQMATAANALWETFLQGRDMPVDKDEWRRAADELGPHVRPIIEFLRAQEERKS